MRGTLSSFVGNAAAGLRSQVAARQAQLVSAVTRILSAVTGLAAVLAGTVIGRVTAAAGQITAIVTAAVAGARARVAGVAGRVVALVTSLPLPDVPGMAAIRAQAVSFLNRAANAVTSLLDGVLGVVRQVAEEAVSAVTAFVREAVQVVQRALAAAATGLLRVVSAAVAALGRLATVVGGLLRAALAATVFPLLRRLEAFVAGRIDAARALVVAHLRLNRDLHVEALESGGAGSTSGDPVDRGAEEDAVVADAVRISSRIVRLFDLMSGAALRSGLALVTRAAAGVRASVLSRVTAILIVITMAVRGVLAALGQVAAVVAAVLRSVVQAVVAGITLIVEAVRNAVQRPLDAVVTLAVGAVARVRDLLAGLVRNLVAGATHVVSDVRSIVTGGAPVPDVRAALDPIVRPPPAEIIVPIVWGLLFGFVVIGAIVVAYVPWLLPVVVALAAWVGWEIALVVVGLFVVLLLLLLLFLVIVILVQLLRRGRRRGRVVLRTTPAGAEIGVGGPPLAVTATLSRIAPLRWTINPGGTVPAGITIAGTGRTVRVTAAHPPHGTVTGGTPIVVRAEVATDALDFADTPDVLVVQVTEAHYDSVPALTPIPPIPRTPPVNTGEPNRDGVGGNTVEVVTTTAPAGRVPAVSLRTPLGAVVSGTTVTPGSRTGDVHLHITDPATGAVLDDTLPSAVNPPTPMVVLIVNAVATRVSSLTNQASPHGAYSAVNAIGFGSSDTVHPPLVRIVGELITGVQDDFNVGPPNAAQGGFNNTFVPRLSAPADFWVDNLVLPFDEPIVGTTQPAVDVNRFVGAGVPQLPRRLIYRQRMVWARWQAPATPVSHPLADGQHVKTLFGTQPVFQFQIRHTFGGIVATAPAVPYAGPPLIVLSNIVVTPAGFGATALAADGVATAHAVVSTTVPGRPVLWTVTAGDITIPAGNPSVPPAPATIQAGGTTGRKDLRAEDVPHPNRRALGSVTVVAVSLRDIRAGQPVVPPGTNRVLVTIRAEPGGRVVDWSVDAAAAGAGVRVAPSRTGPFAPPMAVVVTRPAGFVGNVMVTATDSVVPAATARVRIRFS